MFREREDGVVECDFAPGEEDAAREFLARGASAEAVHLEPAERGPRWVAARLMVTGSLGSLFTIFIFTFGGNELLVFAHVILVWRFCSVFYQQYQYSRVGSFALVPLAGLIVGRRRIPLSRLGTPRRRQYLHPECDFEGRRHNLEELIEVPVDGEPSVVLFRDFPAPYRLPFEMDLLAHRINEAIREATEHAAVRRWLEQQAHPERIKPVERRGPVRRGVGVSPERTSFLQAPDGTVRCQFAPGEEARARAYLLQEPRALPLRWNADDVVRGARTGKRLVLGGLALLVPLPLQLAVLGLEGTADSTLALYTTPAIFFGLGFAAAGRYGMKLRSRFGVFAIDPRRAVVVYFRKLIPFVDLGVVRRTRFRQAIEVEDHPTTYYVKEQVEVAVRGGPPLVLFYDLRLIQEGPHELDLVAERLNMALLEFHERDAVRRWLRQRQRQAGLQGLGEGPG